MAARSDRQRENCAAIKARGASTMKRRRLGRLLAECREPIAFTCHFPAAHFGFPIRTVDPATRAMIDAAAAARREE